MPFYLGICQVVVGKLDEGIETLRLAVATRGSLGSSRYLYFLAHALALAGAREEAAQIWTDLAERNALFAEESRQALSKLDSADSEEEPIAAEAGDAEEFEDEVAESLEEEDEDEDEEFEAHAGEEPASEDDKELADEADEEAEEESTTKA